MAPVFGNENKFYFSLKTKNASSIVSGIINIANKAFDEEVLVIGNRAHPYWNSKSYFFSWSSRSGGGVCG